MTYEEYYGEDLFRLKRMEQILLDIIQNYPTQSYPNDMEPILYCKSRIKQPDSMVCKLQKRGMKTDRCSALANTHDAVGIRIVCSFVDDVYKVAQWLETRPEFEIIKTKDYIAYPKPNGYRSLHLILSFKTESEH